MKIARIVDSNDRVAFASLKEDGALLRLEGDPLEGRISETSETLNPKRRLPPLEPRAILCIGLNYRKHAEESGMKIPEYPVVFMKNPNAAIGHGEPIRIPDVCDDEVDFEAELAVVIGKTCLNVSKEKAFDHILGYSAANDVSARIWQAMKGGSQWVRGKSFDTFAPLGPVLVTPDEIPDPNALSIKGYLNDEEAQNSNTMDMIFNVPTLIEFLSQDTTLPPGTFILTGTPSGIGWARDPKLLLKSGDSYSVEIEGIGRLTNPVA